MAELFEAEFNRIDKARVRVGRKVPDDDLQEACQTLFLKRLRHNSKTMFQDASGRFTQLLKRGKVVKKFSH